MGVLSRLPTQFPARRCRQSLLSIALLSCVVCILWRQSQNCFTTGSKGAIPSKRSAQAWYTARQAAEPTVTVADPPNKALETTSARQSGMALMLDDGTRKSHSVAESTQFVTGFFKGLGDRESFAKLVTSLYFVYKAMEEEFDATPNVNVKQLDFAELRRLPAIEQDMAYFHGPEWQKTIRPSPATVRYCDRIHEVASTNPTLLLGHQYSRYVGDLFGGQMMGGMAVKSLDLQGGAGTSFYNFKDIDNTKAFIERWYSTLNQLNLSEAEKQEIVDEANVVFRLNIDIFEELDGSPFSAAWNMFVSSLKERIGLA